MSYNKFLHNFCPSCIFPTKIEVLQILYVYSVVRVVDEIINLCVTWTFLPTALTSIKVFFMLYSSILLWGF